MAEPMAHRLAGRYEVRSLIGRGGMAEVHLGFDTRLSRVVAIKMLRRDLALDSIFQARFRREAQSAASLNHPNIVAVYDTGEEIVSDATNRSIAIPYIVMEYVEGHTVKELISDGTAVPINEAIEIVSGVLSALQYSHANHLVHRDIKPGNIMLTSDGKVKVMDFGIARALTDSQATMTQTNAVVGTAQYLSPEQARGEAVDARSDLYSTGVVLFELLTGRPPFKGDSAVAVAYQHVEQIPPTPSSILSDIPDSLDRVVLNDGAPTVVQACTFGWKDVGSWPVMKETLPANVDGNTTIGSNEVLFQGTRQTLVSLPKGFGAVIRGLDGYLVTLQDNMLLITPNEDASRTRLIAGEVQMKLGENFL